ncbi:multiheme c-type cytochrome [Bradyrhizobium sp.]|uniref:multiheme c-type cytochrome n=1 Tax=Bradyrhizobium sp. TaxID=376 RepID=UPI004037A95D
MLAIPMNTWRIQLLIGGFFLCLSNGVTPAGERLPADYWRQPLASQGEAPRTWSPEERSLAPDSCGVCHSDKLGEWRTSLHAKAFSPGLVGQLLTYDAADAAACMQCHAPLAEQREAFEAARKKAEARPGADYGLADAGNSCGGCHLRSHRRFGPPQRDTGAIGQSDAAAPHGGVMRVPEFEKSEFCATCHQFPQDQAINGKPLENTFVEWQQSPAARSGTTCQSCHMPERKHLWRGIHDPDMVRSGLTPEFVAEPKRARFRLTSTGIGHAFPTYVTPKVAMKGIALDKAGRPITGSEVSHVIQRQVEMVDGDWVERSDTRLLPGQSATLEISWPESGRVKFWLEVYPDDFYHRQVYPNLLRELVAGSSAAKLIAEADRTAQASHFNLFETVTQRP